VTALTPRNSFVGTSSIEQAQLHSGGTLARVFDCADRLRLILTSISNEPQQQESADYRPDTGEQSRACLIAAEREPPGEPRIDGYGINRIPSSPIN
jgi:hypothetical protein